MFFVFVFFLGWGLNTQPEACSAGLIPICKPNPLSNKLKHLAAHQCSSLQLAWGVWQKTSLKRSLLTKSLHSNEEQVRGAGMAAVTAGGSEACPKLVTRRRWDTLNAAFTKAVFQRRSECQEDAHENL